MQIRSIIIYIWCDVGKVTEKQPCSRAVAVGLRIVVQPATVKPPVVEGDKIN